MLTKRHLLAVGAVVAPMAVWACSSNNNNNGSSSNSSTTPSNSSSSTPSTSSSSSSSAGSSSSSSAGDAGDAGTTLYQRLGGHAGIRKAVDAVVVAELANPQEQSYFFWQLTPTAGHPTADQVSECFVDLLAGAAGGPETYPPPSAIPGLLPDGGDAGDAGSWVCRDMVTIHTPLFISGGTYDEFVTIAANTLAAAPFNVSQADLATIGGLLEGAALKGTIVTKSLTDAGLLYFDAAKAMAADAGGQ